MKQIQDWKLLFQLLGSSNNWTTNAGKGGAVFMAQTQRVH